MWDTSSNQFWSQNPPSYQTMQFWFSLHRSLHSRLRPDIPSYLPAFPLLLFQNKLGLLIKIPLYTQLSPLKVHHILWSIHLDSPLIHIHFLPREALEVIDLMQRKNNRADSIQSMSRVCSIREPKIRCVRETIQMFLRLAIFPRVLSWGRCLMKWDWCRGARWCRSQATTHRFSVVAEGEKQN